MQETRIKFVPKFLFLPFLPFKPVSAFSEASFLVAVSSIEVAETNTSFLASKALGT